MKLQPLQLPTKIYHYSDKPLKQILTLEKQVELNIRPSLGTSTKYNIDKYPYQKHISFFVDKLPFDIVKNNFKSNNFYQLPTIYEHEIDISQLKNNLLYWKFVETPINNLMAENIWDLLKVLNIFDDSYQSKTYHSLNTTINNLVGDEGISYHELSIRILKYKNQTRNMFEKLIQHKDFKEMQNKYAPYVTHLFVYPKDGIIVPSKINKIDMRKY